MRVDGDASCTVSTRDGEIRLLMTFNGAYNYNGGLRRVCLNQQQSLFMQVILVLECSYRRDPAPSPLPFEVGRLIGPPTNTARETFLLFVTGWQGMTRVFIELCRTILWLI